jgi:RimJ/RimL family protein N-acetyltransferase
VNPAQAHTTTMTNSELRTARTLLRSWRPSDLAAFAALNADPAVAEFLPSTLSRIESDALAATIDAHFAEHGFGLWALEIPGRVSFAGFVGLTHPGFERPYATCPDLAWRIAAEHWGLGYASEAAAAVVEHAWDQLALQQVVACTVAANRRSRRVMEKLGMRRDVHADFDHPRLPAGHRLERHVLYRLDCSRWRTQR